METKKSIAVYHDDRTVANVLERMGDQLGLAVTIGNREDVLSSLQALDELPDSVIINQGSGDNRGTEVFRQIAKAVEGSHAMHKVLISGGMIEGKDEADALLQRGMIDAIEIVDNVRDLLTRVAQAGNQET